MEPTPQFFVEGLDWALPYPEVQLSAWLNTLAKHHEGTLGDLTYIYCSDEYLLEINQQFLNHDTYTDIITFDQSEEEDVWEGDIYISVERVAENALEFGATPEQELLRVMAHGLLHIIGFGDKTEAEAQAMRTQEDHALNLFPSPSDD